MYFWISRLRKMWLDKGLKTTVSEGPSRSNMGNGLKHSSKLNGSIFTYLLIPIRQFSLKKFLWVIRKILGLFVNQFTEDNKNSLVDRDNLLTHFQMRLPQKQKILLHFSFSHFNIFKKKITLIADGFLNLRTLKNLVC